MSGFRRAFEKYFLYSSMLQVGCAVALGLALLSTPASSEPAGPSPQKLLEQAEAIRNPTEDYSVDVKLLDKNKGSEETRTYECKVKGTDKALVKYVTPAVDKGTKVLMVGPDMWVYMPSSAKPIRVSANQKLAGNAAYGDVTRLTFIGNYTPKLVKEDVFEGKKAVVLDLNAIDGRPVTYDRIEYWIDKSTHRPLKAIYMTVAGKPLREGFFEDYRDVFGLQRPNSLRLVDYIVKEHVTLMTFTNSKRGKFSDVTFDKQNLSRD